MIPLLLGGEGRDEGELYRASLTIFLEVHGEGEWFNSDDFKKRVANRDLPAIAKRRREPGSANLICRSTATAI
jgi:hypothetical protein